MSQTKDDDNRRARAMDAFCGRLDALVGVSSHDDFVGAVRARTLMIASVVYSLLMALAILQGILALNPPKLFLSIQFLCLVLVAGCAPALVKTKSVKLASMFILIGLYFSVVVNSVRTGGISGQLTPILCSLPIGVGFFVGLRASIICLAFVLLTFGALLWVTVSGTFSFVEYGALIDSQQNFLYLSILTIGLTALSFSFMVVTAQSSRTIENARDAAEASDQQKSDFIANMSHEIRTPMNGVLAMNQLLLASDLTPTQRQYAKTVDESASYLMNLISNLLDLSKIDAGHLDIASDQFDLIELVDFLWATLKVSAENKGLTLVQEVEQGFHRHYIGDPGKTRQILINLVSNAIKFTEQGQVKLALSSEEENIIFRVCDTGPGIHENALETVFDRFHQLERNDGVKEMGSGLGLAISRDLAVKMGGDLTVTSALGKGTTFTLTLPFQTVHVVADEVVKPAETITAENSGATGNLILLAEDNPTNVKVIEAILDSVGSDVTIVGDGQSAVDLLDTHSFDLIIMDHQMPILNGDEAIKCIRARDDWKRDIPILALTANAMAETRDHLIAVGANEFMSKPLDIEELVEAVTRLSSDGYSKRKMVA